MAEMVNETRASQPARCSRLSFKLRGTVGRENDFVMGSLAFCGRREQVGGAEVKKKMVYRVRDYCVAESFKWSNCLREMVLLDAYLR